MRIVISSGNLLKKLNVISGIVSTNNILPIIECFLFKLDKNQLTIVATDLETTMKVSLEVQSGDVGNICIPSRVLLDYLKNLPEQPITLIINQEDLGIQITSEQGDYKIVGQEAKHFPAEPTIQNVSEISIPCSELIDGINKSIVAVNNDDIRPAMSGVFFEMKDNKLILVATDAHRLVRYIKADIDPQNEGGVIVPRKSLHQLKSNILTEETAKIKYNDKHMFVITDSLELNCRLIDQRFPDYRVVIPADNPYKLTLNKEELNSALRRVSIFAQKSTHLVVFDIVGNQLTISAHDSEYAKEGKEQLTCQYKGEDIKIGFNAKSLLELTSVMDGEEILFELSTPSKAVLIKEVNEQQNLLMLIMPLMIGY